MNRPFPSIFGHFASNYYAGDCEGTVSPFVRAPGVALSHVEKVYVFGNVLCHLLVAIHGFFLYLRSFFFWGFIVPNTIFWGCLSFCSMPFRPDGQWSHLCMKYWSKWILWVCGIKVRVEGLEHISPDTVQIFASNHQSFFDIWVLSATIPVKFGWLGKKEVARVPILKMHMKKNGYIVIDRSNREQAILSIDKAAETIRGGNRIAIFPEGTRSSCGKIGEFKKGLFHLCKKTEVPIVPIFLSGSGRALRSGSMIIRPGLIQVKIGRPFSTAMYEKENIVEMMRDFRTVMVDLGRGKGDGKGDVPCLLPF